MPLLTIADLDQEELVVGSHMYRAQMLDATYTNFIGSSEGIGHKYDVEIHGAKTRAPGIHASEISNCLRALVYSIAGTERKPNTRGRDTNMLMRFAMGQAVHAMIQHDWHRIADTSEGVFTFEDEVRIGPDLGGVAAQWNIRSSCDGVITIYEAGEPLVRVGVEIKTKSDKEYAKLKAPEKQHIEQCTTYQATLDLPLMWLIYYNKSNSNFTPSRPPYLFRFDRWRWEEDLEMRFAWATHAAETGLTPDRSEGVYCRWCQFAHTCQPAILNRRSKRGRRR